MGAWSLTGNALAASPTSFLGTTDNNALVIQTGSPSTERLRIDPSGNVGIGTATPSASLHVAPGKVLRIEGGTSATDANDYFSFGGYGTFGIDAPGVVNGRFVVQNSGNVGIGTATPSAALHVAPSNNSSIAVQAQSQSNTGLFATSDSGVGVDARSNSSIGVAASSNSGIGVQAGSQSNTGLFATSQSGTGVVARSNSSIGVEAQSQGNTGLFAHSDSGFGVDARSNSSVGVVASSNSGIGVQAGSQSNTGVFAHSDSGFGVDARSSSGIGVVASGGQFAGFFKGDITVTGDVLLTGADCAEEFDTLETQPHDAGTVMVIDAEGALRESVDAYDKKVAGVVSGGGDYKHALVLDKRSSDESRVPIALVGKVYCKVDAGYSPIEVGDLLTTSATPGHAMKAAEPQKAFGCVIGKALRAVKEGQSLIPILIALQ